MRIKTKTMKILTLTICLLAFLPSCCDRKNYPNHVEEIVSKRRLVIARDSIELEMARDSLIILRERRIERDKKKYGDTPWK